MASNDAALQTFLAEGRGLLEEMETALLTLEEQPDDAEALQAVFRAAHTIKGSAGLFGLDDIVGFTHKAENILDRARDGAIAVDTELTGLLLACQDQIARMLDRVEDGQGPDAEEAEQVAALAGRMAPYLQTDTGDAPVVGADPPAAAAPEGGGLWHISLRFGPEVLRNGMDPISFINYLNTLGEVRRVETLSGRLPDAASMDPEACYLGFEIRFYSEVDKGRIEGVFDFVREACAIRILPPESPVSAYRQLLDELDEDRDYMADILVASGAVAPDERAALLKVPERREADTAPPREKRTEGGTGGNGGPRGSELLRIPADKLDTVINLVGELIVAGDKVENLARRHQDTALQEAMSSVSQLVESIRDGTMHLRMVAIGDTLNRYRRVVRDVAREMDKPIGLTIHGGETEIDKAVVDRLGDPLTHLVRNAVDHGIERPEVRRERGKPEEGQVTLNAYHESGSVVIEVSDDGAGLDRERILAKAREKGVVGADEEPSDSEVWHLIFAAGFSTCEQVSNLSGRGVGMDVVRRGIEALRGSIEIDNYPGAGSTFRIRLPLSLAIIDAFLMGVSGSHYVVPLEMVRECVELTDDMVPDGQDYMDLRGEVLPLVRLREHFEMFGTPPRRRNVVVVRVGDKRAGLVVDELDGEFQAVIKPLGALFADLRGIAGAANLSSGEVALVLDVPVLLEQAAAISARRRAGGAPTSTDEESHSAITANEEVVS